MPVYDATTGQVVELQALAFVAEPATVGSLRPRLALKTSFFDRDFQARLKEVMPSGSWNPEHRLWHWPLTTGSCQKLQEAAGSSLVVHQGLKDWYRDQLALEQEREAARAAALAERAKAEQVKLDAEMALYGQARSSGEEPQFTAGPQLDADGNPVAEPITHLVLGAKDIVRTPVQECPATDRTWVVGGNGDDWRIPLQHDGAAWLSQNGGGVLADEVGLGKSRTCLLAATDAPRALVGVHLIVAPLKVARSTWPAEIHRWAPDARILPWPLGASGAGPDRDRRRSIGWAVEAGQKGTKRPLFLVVNHHALQHYPELSEPQWASVTIDEADQMLSIGHRGKGDTKQAAAAMRLTVHGDGARVACTGTPFRGRLGNLWGLLDWCHPKGFGPKPAFTDAYTTTAGEYGSGSTLDRVAPGREAAWSRLMGDWVLRRTRLAEQRALIDQRVELVDALPEQRQLDEEWKKREHWTGPHKETADYEPKGKAMMRRADGAILPDTITAVTRRLQLSVGPMLGLDDASLMEGKKPSYAGPSPKIDWLLEELRQWGLLEHDWWHLAGETGKVIITSPFNAGLDLVELRLREHLPPSAWVRIDGSTSMKQLDHAKDAFSGARGPGILLLNSKAGGAGLTLDEHCCRMVILSEDWVDDSTTQVIGRIANRTWQAPREIIALRTRGMFDAYVGARVEHQANVQGSVLDLAHAG